jgi:hypothetical protein
MSGRSRLIVGLVLLTSLIVIGVAAASDYYKLRGVKRVDSNLYKTRDGLYIETRYCYHYTYGEDAVLKWNGAYGDNEIIWADDSTCKVKRIWK